MAGFRKQFILHVIIGGIHNIAGRLFALSGVRRAAQPVLMAVLACLLVGFPFSQGFADIAPDAVTISEQDKSIALPLTDKPGDPVRGEAIIVERAKGNCLSCHTISLLAEKAKTMPDRYGDMGQIGPVLDHVAKKYTPAQLRLILVNAKRVFPDTMMPAFYHIKGLVRVDKPYIGRPILTAQQIEDVVAFLSRLK